jgi:hypothetical protein
MLSDAGKMKYMAACQVGHVLVHLIEANGAMGDFIEILLDGMGFSLHEF